MMKKIAATAVLASLLAGCAGPSIQPPQSSNENHARQYNAGFSEVWEHTVDWFATNNIPIKNIERVSGIIGSDYALGSSFSQVDCGEVNPGDMNVLIDSNVSANINVLVRESTSGVTVQPNVFGQGAFTARSGWDGSMIVMRADRCVSTGELERSLHSYIQSRL